MSLLPLITQNTGVTHVIIAAIHLNEGPGNITLNDDPFDAEKFRTLWAEVAWLRGAGVKVLGMLGGAAKGSFERLGGSDEEVSCLGRLLCFGRNLLMLGRGWVMVLLSSSFDQLPSSRLSHLLKSHTNPNH